MFAAVRRNRLVAFFLLLLCSGCATTPYRYGGEYYTTHDVPLKPGESQIERGRPAPVIDGLGWVIGIPSKILMLDGRTDNHNISPETETCLENYLVKNDLDKVKVRINEYDPGGEWRRMTANESISKPVKYTFGVLSVTCYTLFPGRIWGGDGYNPYTNTISLYSDIPALALYEGGNAKYYAKKEYKGFYAIFCGGLGRSFNASGDALGYIQENGTAADMKEGYRALCPVVVTSVTSPILEVLVPPFALSAYAAGHVTAAAKVATVKDADFAGKKEPRTDAPPEFSSVEMSQPAMLPDAMPTAVPADRMPPETLTLTPLPEVSDLIPPPTSDGAQ